MQDLLHISSVRQPCEHTFVRPLELRTEALELIAQGVNDCEISRRLGVPRTTVRDWRKPRYFPKRPSNSRCPRCGGRTKRIVLLPAQYAELLGLYLGDGHITAMARSEQLRLFLDAAYPKIVANAEALLRCVFPSNEVGRVLAHEGRMCALAVLAASLVRVSATRRRQEAPPPHRPRAVAGAKSRRGAVGLPEGLLRSDGCAFINRTGPYEYLSYDFANHSSDILDLFERTCHGLGLRPRRYARCIRLNRREDVARLLMHVGMKT